MALAYVFMAVAFTWIYLKGREDKPWLPQGLRYGVAIALLSAVVDIPSSSAAARNEPLRAMAMTASRSFSPGRCIVPLSATRRPFLSCLSEQVSRPR